MKSLDYRDVSLVSRQISTISSRDEIDTSVEFCGRKLTVPIIASPMKDTCDGYMASLMLEHGAFGIIHRFSSVAQQVYEYKQAKGAGCAIGINGDWEERYEALYDAGCRIFCIDVASGANKNILPNIKRIQQDGDSYIIIGNTVSAEGFLFLEFSQVNAVRVGVAGGAGCTTKHATGIFHPMISLVKETYHSRQNHHVSIIADGGIKEPADFCKSIIFGADVAMFGSLLANTKESPAEKIFEDGKRYTQFSGSASERVQQTYKDIPKYIEGRTTLLEYKEETVKELLNRFTEGLKSSMSYFNARNLEEYRRNIDYVTV
jgi:IMP dehydrogenase/GMP reductase